MKKGTTLVLVLLFGGAATGLYFGIDHYRGKEDEAPKSKGRVEEANTKDKSKPSPLGVMSPELANLETGDFKGEETVKGDRIHRFRPQPKKPEVIIQEAPRQKEIAKERPAKATKPTKMPALVHSFSGINLAEPFVKEAPQVFAPRGTLIACQLVLTVDSSSIETPILGLVSQDVYHNDKLIIPAGAEVHAKASAGRVRNRIEVNGNWTIVWQDGKQYQLQGIALNREKDPDGKGWGITDGSAGIKGSILKSDDYLELKLFAAKFMEGIASSSQETTESIFGPVPDTSLSNAGLEGVSEVGKTYANLLLERIKEEGYFVRVPTGTEFYIYVTQVIEPELASVAGLAQNQSSSQSWELKEQAFRAEQERIAQHTIPPVRNETLGESKEERRIREALNKRARMLKSVEKQYNRQKK